jgi:hypothetical protein
MLNGDTCTANAGFSENPSTSADQESSQITLSRAQKRAQKFS